MRKIFSMFDYILILIVVLLVSLGIMFIYSSSINSQGISVTNEYLKQITWAIIGLVIMIALTIYDYRKTEPLTFILYAVLIVLLIYTRFFGRYVNGAKSWIGFGELGIQPSEFGKIFFILYLAKTLDESVNVHPVKRFAKAVIVLMIPMGLILLQPDLGTASVYVPIFIVMCFIAGVPLRFLNFVLGFGIGTIIFAILPVWNSEISDVIHIEFNFVLINIVQNDCDSNAYPAVY